MGTLSHNWVEEIAVEVRMIFLYFVAILYVNIKHTCANSNFPRLNK